MVKRLKDLQKDLDSCVFEKNPGIGLEGELVLEEDIVDTILKVPELVQKWNKLTENCTYEQLTQGTLVTIIKMEIKILQLMYIHKVGFRSDIRHKSVRGLVSKRLNDSMRMALTAKAASERLSRLLRE